MTAKQNRKKFTMESGWVITCTVDSGGIYPKALMPASSMVWHSPKAMV